VSDRQRLLDVVEETRFSPERIAAETRTIYESLLTTSPYLDGPNFTQFHPADLRQLFDLYDSTFFGGLCQAAVALHGLHFRISNRMTNAGGKTFQYRRRDRPDDRSYEIAISSTLLFLTFRNVERTVTVTGVECRDRIEALQRIFEHELIHLVEFLLWDTSQCSATRYQSMASGLFGHTDHRHELITPRETASKQFGVHVRSRVRFRCRGSNTSGS